MHPFSRCTLGVVLAAASSTALAQAAPAGSQFNPRLSLILNGHFAHARSDLPADVPGFLMAEETGFVEQGLSIGESELVLEANVDDRFHGWASVALTPEGEVELEEAYVNTLALPHGLALKMGRFFSDLGYQNRQHAHAWDFADASLVYRALLGNQYGDDGLQLRWVAPVDLLVEVGAEAFRGGAHPGGGENRDGIKAWTGFVHVGGDAGASGSWRAGLWHLDTDADARATGDEVTTLFTGDSAITGVDLVYKWAPQGNPAVTNLVIQGEYLLRREQGEATYDPDGADPANPGPITSAYDGRQAGFYVQSVYQFMPRWRAGLRYDRVTADNDVATATPGTSLEQLADDARAPDRWTAMADFSNSEFSRLRLQFSHDRSRPGGVRDDQVVVQYIFSLGAHPAHQF